jgi:ligand-binding sensor domain-containing protein
MLQPIAALRAALILVLALVAAASPARAQGDADAFTPYISARDLTDMAADGAGNLWIASDGGGALRFDLETASWTQFPRLRGTGPRGNDLVTTCVDALGRVWFGSATVGFTFYDPATGRWDRDAEEWPDPSINVIRCLGGGVYIGTVGGLSLKPTPSRTDICAETDPGCIVPSYFVNDYELLNDTLWVATDEGLGRFNGVRWDSLNALPAGSQGENVLSLAAHRGLLWGVFDAGGDNPRIRRLQGAAWAEAGGAARRLVVSGGALHAINGRSISVWTDDGWVALVLPGGPDIRDLERFGEGTTSEFYLATADGLERYRVGEAATTRFQPPGPPLLGEFQGLTVDSRGTVWGGTKIGPLGIVSFDGETWTLTEPGASGLEAQWNFALYADRDDDLWIGHCCCFSPGICRIDLGCGDGITGLTSYQNAWAFDQDERGRMWAGTSGQGVVVLQTTGTCSWGTRDSITVANSGGALSSLSVAAVAVTADGTYFGHEFNGLDYWPHGGDLESGRDGSTWTRIAATFPLFDDVVGGMARQGEDVWVGTSSGIHRFREGALLNRCQTRDDDAPGETPRKVNALVTDEFGGLWVGTESGLLHLPRGASCNGSSGEFEVFDRTNSALPDDNVQSAALNPVDGSVWFGTARGLLRVDPAALSGGTQVEDQVVLYPNPFQIRTGSSVQVGLEIGGVRVQPAPREAYERPVVYDVAGVEVARFDEDNVIGGWSWRGRNLNGDAVAPGLYLVRVTEADGGAVKVLRLGVVR